MSSPSPAPSTASRQKKREDKVSRKVTITPAGLYFPPPHDRAIRNTILITNTSSTSFIFKMRTMDPHRYAVKPRLGVVSPHAATRVTIALNPLQPTETAEKFAHHHFEVITKPIPSEHTNKKHDPKELWELCASQETECDVWIPCHFSADAAVPKDAELVIPGSNAPSASPQPSTASLAERGGSSEQPELLEKAETSQFVATPTPAKSALKPSLEEAANAAAASAGGSAATVVTRAKDTKEALQGDIEKLRASETTAVQKLRSSQGTSAQHQEAAKALQTASSASPSQRLESASGVYLSKVVFFMILAYVAGIAVRQCLPWDRSGAFATN